MNNKSEIPYFFNKNKSEFTKGDFSLISSERFHLENKNLSADLENNIYKYESNTKYGIAFYFINNFIEEEKDLKNIHIRIFSEDKVDFYIFKQKNNGKSIYKIVSAKTTHKKIEIIEEIPVDSEDEQLLQTINKTSIDTGAFWLYYKEALKNSNTTNVRKELVKVLSDLRDNLKLEIQDDIQVQALIDRTLFIKFLEDRHIINSYFYGSDIEYKEILKTKDPKKVNDLFHKVHEIFNNYLFNDPTIPNEVLTSKVLQIIEDSIAGVKHGQLTLFDLRFDIIPIEAISQIYEIFFDTEQREKGIYYTPKTLTNFIINQTVDKLGRIIDPACGSGAFLISAYKKILKLADNEPVKVHEKIDFRVNLIKKYIYGIEKEEKARRLTIFALYLSILEDLTDEENKELKVFLENNKNYKLFKKNIGENIERADTFSPNQFDNAKFDFIVGNPPWKKDFDNEENDKTLVPAINYLKENSDSFSGKRELSELFLHKAKIWEQANTRYGFVVNTSNFTNEYSKFQDFFYKNFSIEKFYEITDMKFFTASEPAIVCIYTAKQNSNNKIILNIPKANEFSKLFKSILIIEEDNISIEQDSLIKTDNKENIPLRNLLVGSNGDFTIINYLESRRFEKFENSVLKDGKGECYINQGITIYSKEKMRKIFNINLNGYSNDDIKKLRDKFYLENTSKEKTPIFCYPYLKTKNIGKFIFSSSKIELYLPHDISNLERPRTEEILSGNRILILRKSNELKAVFVHVNHGRFYPTCDINTIKLNNQDYYFFTAVLNSNIVEYYLKIKFWQRIYAGEPRINQDPILHIPIPINKNEQLVNEISKLSKQLTNQEVEFKDKEEELNDLIYKLYGIGIIEKQRINDFFIKDKEKVKKTDLQNYANEFSEYLSDYLNLDTEIKTDIFDENSLVQGISVVKIYFGKKGEEYPKSKKVGRYLLLDLLKDVSKANILTLRERIYGENTICLIKDNLKKSWSLTKAGEDAIAELNKINKHKSQKN